MFNLETVLSIFNKKGTLLKWLQNLEEALKGDTLEGVEINQPTITTAIMKFLFKDGTDLESDPINLPAGPAGPAGKDGADGADGVTPLVYDLVQQWVGDSLKIGDVLQLTLSEFNRTPAVNETFIAFLNYASLPSNIVKSYAVSFKVNSVNTEENIVLSEVTAFIETTGKAGTSITSITTQGSREVDGYTETEIDVSTNDSATPLTFSVLAKNGAPGVNSNGIVNITTTGVGPGTGQYEGYTKTNITVETDDDTMPFEVYAKDGASGSNKQLYYHRLKLDNAIYAVFITSDYTPMDGDKLASLLATNNEYPACGKYDGSRFCIGLTLAPNYTDITYNLFNPQTGVVSSDFVPKDIISIVDEVLPMP